LAALVVKGSRGDPEVVDSAGPVAFPTRHLSGVALVRSVAGIVARGRRQFGRVDALAGHRLRLVRPREEFAHVVGPAVEPAG